MRVSSREPGKSIFRFRDHPLDTRNYPPGIAYIVANEAAERFSFYGLKSILVVFFTNYLIFQSSTSSHMGPEQAKQWFHTWASCCYLFPVVGAVISDLWFGKFWTIVFFSLICCSGHLVLSFGLTPTYLTIGLGLVALGAGGIKPCVSAHVGDQFSSGNKFLIPKMFGWFYLAINVGAFFAQLAGPWFLEGFASSMGLPLSYGPLIAFGMPGIFMFLATVIFWLGRNKFAHIPASSWRDVSSLSNKSGVKSILFLVIVYCFTAIYWSLSEQTFSSWILQAEKMNLHLCGVSWRASQFTAVSAILIWIYIPLLNFLVYPLLAKRLRVTPVNKIAIGLVMAGLSFIVIAEAQRLIDSGLRPSILWQISAYMVLTIGECLVCVTGLELSYIFGIKSLKSVSMSLWLLSTSLGNAFTAIVNLVIQNRDGTLLLNGASYFLFFAALGIISGVGLLFLERRGLMRLTDNPI